MTSTRRSRLIVISNRLPFTLGRSPEGDLTLKPGSGGLVTALLPVLRNRGGTWLGWPGTWEDVPGLRKVVAGASHDLGLPSCRSPSPIASTNSTTWATPTRVSGPSFMICLRCAASTLSTAGLHGGQRRFAERTARTSSPGDFVWVHDYQLMMVGAETAPPLGRFQTLAFFLHIPFPAPDIFMKLPERLAILRGLMEFDLVGFQTQRDRRNFIQCVRQLIGGRECAPWAPFIGYGWRNERCTWAPSPSALTTPGSAAAPRSSKARG